MARVRHWAGAQMWLLGEGASGNEALSLTRRFTEPGRLDALYVPTCRERFTDPGFHAEVAEALQASGTMAWWIGSHDSPRAATTLGDGSAASAKALIAVMALSPGPLLLFQGDELGLPQPRLDRHEISDPFDLEFWPDGPGRENARVPPPWRDARHGGFTTGTSWLPMRWSGVASAQAQASNPDSVLSFTRDMLAMRRRFGWGRPDQFSVQAQGPLLRIQTRGDRGPTTANINLSPETAGDAQPWCVSLSTSDERQSNKRA